MAGASKASSSNSTISKAGGSGGGGGGVAVAVAPPRVAEVAEEAHRVGRQRLAMMLLEEFETAPSEQVCNVCLCALLCCVVLCCVVLCVSFVCLLCCVPLLARAACLPLLRALLCMRAFRCVVCLLCACALSHPLPSSLPQSPTQVPLLLQMNELPTALTRAITSSDVELIHLVLLHGRSSLADPGTYLHSKAEAPNTTTHAFPLLTHTLSCPSTPISEFFDLILQQPSAQELLASYCRRRDPEFLKSLYYHANLPIEAAGLAIREAYKAASWAQRMRGLSIGLQFYEHSNMPSLAKLTEEQLKLLDAQRGLEKSTRGMLRPARRSPA